MEQTIYNKIGAGYNHTRTADPYIAERLVELLQPKDGGCYLDIGCGTGNYTIKLAERGLSMTGIDPSDVMLTEAKTKSNLINWVHGQAEDIEFPDDTFDGAIATLTTHHWSDLGAGFRELFRVLKQGARMVLFTFTPEQEQGYWLNYYFPEMMKKSVRKAIPMAVVESAALKAGFVIAAVEKYDVLEDLADLFGYSGKHNPEIYFDEQVRKGISSFSVLADPDEVASGLGRLRNDIDTGHFKAVKKAYENEHGDYKFVVLSKE